MNPPDWLINLFTTLIGGGVISAIITFVLNRKKSDAEVKSIEAETDMRIVEVVSKQNESLREEIADLRRKLEAVEQAKEALSRSETSLMNRVRELENLVRDGKGFYDAFHCKAIFECSPTAMAIVSVEENRFLAANTAFCNWLGYTFGEVLGMTVMDITSPADWEQEQEMRERCISGEMLQYNVRNGYKAKWSTSFSPAVVTVRLMRDKGVPLHYILFIVPMNHPTS